MEGEDLLHVDSLREAMHALYGSDVSITASTPVAGGCINEGRRLELSNGALLFCKENSSSDSRVFLTERAGLSCLRRVSMRSGGPYIPRVHAVIAAREKQYLLMEWLETTSAGPGSAAAFGRSLAALHRELPVLEDIEPVSTKSSDGNRKQPIQQFGFNMDNFIGTTPQPNQWTDSWSSFFGNYRLRQLYELVRRKGLLDSSNDPAFERILRRLPDLLPEPDAPSVLHGDLWSGNVMYGTGGTAMLIDPAVYIGHHEADLALLELFGNPGRAFFSAYADEFQLDSGYSQRRDLYNLYHLLNHLYIFGIGYRNSVAQVIASYS